MTPFPFLVLAGVLGLAIGSFLNVVIHRVPLGESVVSPPSRCPRCETRIKGRHNVPVLGWLVLRGRCASCALPISVRYPLVEAATGLLFVAVTARLGLVAALPAFLYLAAVGVALALIDVDGHRPPDSIVLPSFAVALALLVPADAVAGDWYPITRGALGGALLAGLVLAARLFAPDSLHPGTAKLAALLGGQLAWISWHALVIGATAAAASIAVAVALRAAEPRPAAGSAAAGSGPVESSVRTSVRVPVAACLIATTVLTVLVTA